ncbi:MAG: hypothetical protein LW814_19160 [Anabaena sp. CoA2_C59]|jgi:hypothetical protein|uniref:Uncharacterized protein n=1 Tax=Aphanizomenon flos-aquae FACHB-1249 TaxID=2692889 RepID=A0ABR8IWU4_APHFL|nr:MULTISPECIES: hypothetical protein [Aphanizomenon]MCE2907101.1 hypothetical protein [Anabaena sp. CoA2_C59]MBD2390739.1 hypothetical protein [Aphanizomenon flos-aquae FACHB-1171]MBD2557902.1 hypothetical protein [Aphanizomenon flos-aquae FACHB-1290]MBD2633630.1 hypothetical protein [Aphanizomenon sp. FACHB-1399]MBD2644067.1 hypothetical protein [Aphanizomenon sp. FACHB-1401]
MANIQISALLPVGYDLFNDATSFLDELATEEVQNVIGGGFGHYYGYGHHGGYRRYYGYGHHGGYSGYSGYRHNHHHASYC